MAANQDAWAAGQSLGLSHNQTSGFTPDSVGVSDAYRGMTVSAAQYRSQSDTVKVKDLTEKENTEEVK